MTEQLISYKTAKLAKEKGFTWRVFAQYTKHGNAKKETITNFYVLHNFNHRDWGSYSFSAPTQPLLAKWLYETRGYFIEVFMDDDKTFGFLISLITSEGRIDQPIKRGFDNPQKALEEGLKKTLKLL